jgi:hypothetical protein
VTPLIDAPVLVGREEHISVHLENTSDTDVTVTGGVIEGSYPTVLTGYDYIKSTDTGGPSLDAYEDLLSSGKTLQLIELENDDYQEVALPFTFTFYGLNYDSIFVCSNGYITFGSGSDEYDPRDLFGIGNEPYNVIAPCFTDLYRVDFSEPDGFYFYADDERAVVQFEGIVGRTFQIVLLPTGDIFFYYVEGDYSDGLIGLQNVDGSSALNISYAGSSEITVPSAIHISFTTEVIVHDYPVLLSGQPVVLAANSSADVDFALTVPSFIDTNFVGELVVDTNSDGQVVVPINLDVLGPQLIKAPLPGDSFTLGDVVAFEIESAFFSDPISSVTFFIDGITAQSGLDASFNFDTNAFTEGEHELYAVVTFGDEKTVQTETVSIQVYADTDGDGLYDFEELMWGFDPNYVDAMEDADSDRYPNVYELRNGSNPRSGDASYSAVSDGMPEQPTPTWVLDIAGEGDYTEMADVMFAIDSFSQTEAYGILEVKAGHYTATNWDSGIWLYNIPIMVIASAGPEETTLEMDGTSNATRIGIGGSVVDGFTFVAAGLSEAYNYGHLYVSFWGGDEINEVLVQNCIFTGNVNSYSVWVNPAGSDGALTLRNVIFRDIQSEKSLLWNGSEGIGFTGELLLEHCTFLNNQTYPNGSVEEEDAHYLQDWFDGESVSFVNCILSD